MARWRRLARAGNKLLACAVGGETAHGDRLWTVPRFLAIHPIYKKTEVDIPNSDLAYVHYVEELTFSPRFRRPSYSQTDSSTGITRSVSQEIIAVGRLASDADDKLPYNGNGLAIDDLNSHGVGVYRYPAAKQTRYVFNAGVVCHAVTTETGPGRTPRTTESYFLRDTSVTMIFDWNTNSLERYVWEPTEAEIEIMGPYWDVSVIDEGAYPNIWVEHGQNQTEYVYEEMDDEDFPVGVDYQRSA